MERIKRIDVGSRKESVYDTLNRQRHNRFGLDLVISDAFDEDFIRAYLYGLVKIKINATETRDGVLHFATDADKLKYDSLSNFYNNKNSVDSVFYRGRMFIPAHKLGIQGVSKGYYERIVSKNFVFLTKHYKTFDLIHYGAKKYSKLFRAYSISTDSEIVKVNTKKLFTSYFSENKKEVQKYLRKNKIDYKTCSREQLTALIKFCNEF